jgi:hypothetical protein
MIEAAAPSREGERLRTAAVALLLLCVGAATVGVVVASANPGLAIVPVALVATAYAAALAPLRWSAAALLLAVLSLEVSTDAAGTWATPLAALGDLLHDNLERSAGIPGVPLNGLDVVAIFLLGVAVLRRGDACTDRGASVAVPGVVAAFLLLHVGGILYADVVGLVRGTGAAPWKLHQLLQVPLLAVLFLAALRGPRDHRLLGRIVIVAACIKALLAVWVQRVAAPALTGGRLAYATNHGDSVLLAVAAFILLVDLAERTDLRRVANAGVLLPLILLGMYENDRRTAWVMLAMSAVAAYVLGPPRRWKRTVTRVALLAGPVLVLYAAVGWNRHGVLFAPVQTLRTLSDASVDRSTLWREVENWNLAMSIREHPIAGIGLGGEYTEFVRGDDISSIFPEFKAFPHNSVLGLLLFSGAIGFTAIWSLFGLVVFLAVRSHRLARGAEDRVAALGCIATMIACAVLAYGDTGAHFPQYRVLTALAIAVSAKLAVATGAWPAPAKRGGRAAAGR